MQPLGSETVKILFTGRGTSGSWRVRGAQLSAALGAEAIPNAIHSEADVVVVVKRVEDRTLRAMRGRKIVWDIVDAYPQPVGNTWSEREAFTWLRDEMQRISPDAVIAPTARMAEELRQFPVPVLWLRHHHRPGIARNSIRERVRVVGYEGSPSYLEVCQKWIRAECERISAAFVVNPDRLADCDVVLAVRNSKGYAPRHWKSGVKLENAHASGTPFIGARECGYTEIATGCEYWADGPGELRVALDWLVDQSAREQIHDRFVQSAYPVERAAADLQKFLRHTFA
jgi:hypothetical protein